ncbi:hypothetical protein [Xanthomonas campestris]|uniref:hypothetical protein n=1 Tax=Xanthomonas campestris TaxID=339 RepID=UPI00389057B1
MATNTHHSGRAIQPNPSNPATQHSARSHDQHQRIQHGPQCLHQSQVADTLRLQRKQQRPEQVFAKIARQPARVGDRHRRGQRGFKQPIELRE